MRLLTLHIRLPLQQIHLDQSFFSCIIPRTTIPPIHRIIHISCFYRVVMNVTHDSVQAQCGVNAYRMIAMFPKLMVCFSASGFCGIGKTVQHPQSSAFARMLNCSNDLQTCVFFETGYCFSQFAIWMWKYGVHMVRHDDICVDAQTKVVSAIIECLKNDTGVYTTCKNVDPVNDGKCDEVWCEFISNHVACAWGWHVW